MFRFTIRDMLWLTVVVALAVLWAVEHQQLAELRDVIHAQDAKKRIAELRERELRGGVILTPAPKLVFPGLERYDRKPPRRKDE